MNFTKKDFISSLITGITAGSLGWWVISFSGFPEFYGISFGILIVVVPIAWMVGVKLGYFLGKWIQPFTQFGKFAAVGFTNFTVDAGVLDFLILLTGANRGLAFSGFKAISFFFAVTHSYFWNKYWVFESKNQNQGQEFSKFLTVMIASSIVNIIVASSVVNYISPQFGLTANAWANAGSIAGSAMALIFSFIGFKIGVFKK